MESIMSGSTVTEESLVMSRGGGLTEFTSCKAAAVRLCGGASL